MNLTVAEMNVKSIYSHVFIVAICCWKYGVCDFAWLKFHHGKNKVPCIKLHFRNKYCTFTPLHLSDSFSNWLFFSFCPGEQNVCLVTSLLSLQPWKGRSVPSSALALVRRCCWTRWILLQNLDHYKEAVDHRRTLVPAYKDGLTVWVSTKNLSLRMESRKLALRFFGPFPVSKVVNPATVRLKLHRAMQVHPTFPVSHLRPAKESPLGPASSSWWSWAVRCRPWGEGTVTSSG